MSETNGKPFTSFPYIKTPASYGVINLISGPIAPEGAVVQTFRASSGLLRKTSMASKSENGVVRLAATGPVKANLSLPMSLVSPSATDLTSAGPASRMGLRHTFGLGPAAFGQQCCSLASTLVHEAVHGLGYGPEDRPYQIEKYCFGCTVPGKQ